MKNFYQRVNIDEGNLTPRKMIEILSLIPQDLQDIPFNVHTSGEVYPTSFEFFVTESDAEESKIRKEETNDPDYCSWLEIH
jgi:hypothetical protein